MAPWQNWSQQNTYNPPGKQRFDEINQTIDCLRHELFLNDAVIKNELEMQMSSKYDRAIVAAELYRDRLVALTESSRSQIMQIQSGATVGNFFANNEDTFYIYPHQIQNNWSAYSYENNHSSYYYPNRAVNNKRKRKWNSPNTYVVPVNPAKKSFVPANNTTGKKPCLLDRSAGAKKPVAVGAATAKAGPSKINTAKTNTGWKPETTVNNIAKADPSSDTAVKVFTATKTNAAAKANPNVDKHAASMKPELNATLSIKPTVPRPIVKKEPNLANTEAIPALFSTNLSPIKPSTDRVYKTENGTSSPLNVTVLVKTEPDDNSMQDDLENHI